MDLLTSALPYTTQKIGMSTPSEIIERAFEKRLGGFDAVAALRSRTLEVRRWTSAHAVARSPGRDAALSAAESTSRIIGGGNLAASIRLIGVNPFDRRQETFVVPRKTAELIPNVLMCFIGRLNDGDGRADHHAAVTTPIWSNVVAAGSLPKPSNNSSER